MKLENGVCTSSEANMTGQISKDMVEIQMPVWGIVGLHSQSNSLVGITSWGLGCAAVS